MSKFCLIKLAFFRGKFDKLKVISDLTKLRKLFFSLIVPM